MKYHKVCYECVMNNDCLLQDDDAVESCEDIQTYEDDILRLEAEDDN